MEKKAKETGESAADIRKKKDQVSQLRKSRSHFDQLQEREDRKASERQVEEQGVRYSQLSKSLMRSTAKTTKVL